MSFISGTAGSVKIGSTPYGFDKWRIAMRSNLPKVTNFTGGGYQQNVGGVVGGTLTLSGPFDSTAMGFTVNTSYVFVLGMDTGVSLTVTARVAGIEVDNSVEDAPRVSVTAESTGSFTAAIA